MSKIYHESMIDRRKSNVLAHYGIFSSMLKNHWSMSIKMKYSFMPPVCDRWFLT